MDLIQSLSTPIRRFIYDSNWQALSRIQEASIRFVNQSNDNFILAAPTASGKTEAAFLPAINSIQDWSSGLKIIYVSPLIALINDQFKRISDLCAYLDVPVTSWHGEASVTLKKKLIKEPRGILLITPESLEAMLSVNPQNAQALFPGVEWVMIDEIHNFLGTNRGIQLQSLLERMEVYMTKKPRYIGMSATLDKEGYEQSKSFFPKPSETKIILDKNKNKLTTTIEYLPKTVKGVSRKAVNSIYQLSQSQSMLVFPNSRAAVEELTDALKKQARKGNSHSNYFAHHASTSKSHRQMVEDFAKRSRGEKFTIFCTSTLELGIDIGSVDSVVQYGATSSVSSLAQRIGRSGRRTKESQLLFIGVDEWDLLQGLVTISLYERGMLDTKAQISKPYDVLAHQMISILLENPEIKVDEFVELIKEKRMTKEISRGELNTLLTHLIKEKYIELDPPYIFTGTKAETLLRSYEFYGMFIESTLFRVVDSDKTIGQIPLSPTVKEGNNILLSGSVWTIQNVLIKTKKIVVKKAARGTPPKFDPNAAGSVSTIVRQEMKRLLLSSEEWESYVVEVQEVLVKLSEKVSPIGQFDYFVEDNGLKLYAFQGTRVMHTLATLLEIVSGQLVEVDNADGSLRVKDIRTHIQTLKEELPSITEIRQFFLDSPEKMEKTLVDIKYKDLMPDKLKAEYIVNNIFDIEGVESYLRGNEDG